ncbi:MAG: glycosyltransferase family 2 protein [Treponema sp.]|nr:glycosyltransferase family 2 protein [Treponema sp.]
MIDIILASYNGEKYIAQQLLSLVAQTFKDWKCIIHDDGSTDRTVEIIKKFCSVDSRFVFVEDSVQLKNPGKNFLQALEYSTSDFICFCDQDDIWLEAKLEKLYSAILSKDNSIPQAVFCNAYLWNSQTNKIWGNATLAFPSNVESLLFLNCGIQGASAIFNKKMRNYLLVKTGNLVMHDWYLTILACTVGKIGYLHENLMLYRQHENNVTGNASGSISEKFKNFFKNKNPLVDKKHYESLVCFYDAWKKKLNENDSRSICRFIKSVDKNFFYRLFMILSENWNIYGSKIKLILKFFIRPYFGGNR